MPDSDFFRLMTACDQGRPTPPVIFLHGFYEFLGEIALNRLVELFLPEKTEMNYRRCYFDGEEALSWSDLLQEAASASFFVRGRRVLAAVIRERKYLGLPGKEVQQEIQAYLREPNPNTLLVIYLSLDLGRDDYKGLKSKVDAMRRFLAHDNVLAVDLNRAGGAEISAYARSYFSNQGIKITPAAQERLLDILGNEPAQIIQQLPKLAMAAAESKVIDSGDVDSVITGISSHSIWELTEAVEKGDICAYLNILRFLFRNSIAPTFIIGTLVAYYNRIFIAKFLLQQKFGVSDIGRVLNQPSFLLDSFIRLVKGFSPARIDGVCRLLRRLDGGAKSNGEEWARSALQNLIFELRALPR